jgi:hypothetical protein
MLSLPREIMQQKQLRESIALQPKTAEDRQHLQDVIYDIASQAHAHLSRARNLYQQCRSGQVTTPTPTPTPSTTSSATATNSNSASSSVSSSSSSSSSSQSAVSSQQLKQQANQAIAVFLPAVSSQYYLDLLQEYAFDPFHLDEVLAVQKQSPLNLQYRMLKTRYLKSF